ncbi:PREDICTED: uncharacterized protein LOC109580573 [Amphimedon queenslandica]|nr:PREDICTED: uncharacterized protein LOC109580573 [Amphimedon queenslandica]|eukprot:XP_019849449.1 PREDICTED: uncharacterized protein LOC109580573 [Amphimedon queenslandica]
MISGNDIKGTNDVHSTATGPAPPTGNNKPLIRNPPLSPIALMDIPDDRPKVSELIEFHELLIKGQLEESVPLLDADTMRKIRNAVNDHEGMSLLIRTFEEHPTLLHEMRVATGKIKGSSQKIKFPPPIAPKPKSLSQSGRSQPTSIAKVPQPLSQTTQPPPIAHKSSRSQDSSSAPHDPTGTVLQDKEGMKDPSSFKRMEESMSPEYNTMKKMLADLVDLLAGNAPVISQLNNHLFSSDLISKAVHVTVESTAGLTPYDRANKIFSSVLATLECHLNPNSVFSSLIMSLQKVGLNNMASKLMKNLKMKGGFVDPTLEQQPSVSKRPLQSVDVTAQSHRPQPTIIHSQSSAPTTVIELSSKSEVAVNIGSLNSRFASLDSNIRDEFEELVEKGRVKLKAVARSAAAYLDIPVFTLKYGNVDELFDSLKKYCNFFSCGVLKHLTDTYLSNTQTELTQYIDSVDKFSELSQLKHIRSTIKDKLSSLPAAASPTTSDQTKPVVIKLNDRWEEMTLNNFKRVLQYYFGHKVADISSIVDIDFSSVVITLLIPTSLSQSLIDTISNKMNSMSKLGISEVAFDNKVSPFRKVDYGNFDISLHESVKAGDSFEVSMLLQLGADPNSKDERGKSAVEIANKGGHTQIKEILLSSGAQKQLCAQDYKPPLSKAQKVPCKDFNYQVTGGNIAAIEFGTTSVSLACTTKGDDAVSTFSLDDEERITHVSNTVLFKREGKAISLIAFGNRARSLFTTGRKSGGYDKEIIYSEKIKMILRREKGVDRQTLVESFSGEKFYLIEVIAFILQYLKDQLIDRLSRTVRPLKTTDFDWVITVPHAIWDARGKRMMREAAYMAGLLTESKRISEFTPISSRPLPVPDEVNPDKLSLALEPEAVALYSQETVVEQVKGQPSAAVISRPTEYTVIDVGDGTIDITARVEVDGGIVVQNVPTGNAWGGTQVNEEFSKLLQEIVSDPGFKKLIAFEDCKKNQATLNNIVYIEFEQQKMLFGQGKIKEIAVGLTRNFVRCYEKALITGVEKMCGIEYDEDMNDTLFIEESVTESKLFGPVIQGIIDCTLSAIEKIANCPNTFYLVGAFGGCKYVHEKISAAIESHYQSKGHKGTCSVILPPTPHLAVAAGAVMWRKNPKKLKARRADATYGIGIAAIFDPIKHDEAFKYYNEETCCIEVCNALLEKGKLVGADQVVTTTITPEQEDAIKMSIIIYSTPHSKIQYENKKTSVTVIGELVIDVPNADNLPLHKRVVDVTLDFTHTEIHARAYYRVTGEEVKTVCDYI